LADHFDGYENHHFEAFCIGLLVLLTTSTAAFPQRNCDPDAGLVDASCMSDPDPAPEPPSQARTAQAALIEYVSFPDDPQTRPRIRRQSNSMSLEVCFDVCDYYRATRAGAESDLWDLAFLHQYYFAGVVDAEKFSARYRLLAPSVLKAHSTACQPAPDQELARCVVSQMVASLGVSAWFVRYDEGGRCQAPIDFFNGGFLGKFSCRKVKRTD
jgi:hypothetical protein